MASAKNCYRGFRLSGFEVNIQGGSKIFFWGSVVCGFHAIKTYLYDLLYQANNDSLDFKKQQNISEKMAERAFIKIGGKNSNMAGN